MAGPTFSAPLPLPLGLALEVAEEVPAPTNPGYASLLWIWGGGGQVVLVDDGGGVTPDTTAYYIPMHRRGRRR